jgi:2-C-methyl-D-erythritol 4-phosphate cytidylyltransferase
MKIAVIIPAAGTARRFQEPASAGAAPKAPKNKIELDLCGKPVFLRSVELFLKRPSVGQIILAVNPDQVEDFRFRWGDKLAFHGVDVVPGGRTERWETVLKALEAVSADCTHAAIHDAARPLTSSRLIDRIFEAAETHTAVIPGAPVAATLKRVVEVPPSAEEADPLDAILGSAGKEQIALKRVVETVSRGDMIEVQTPQVFELALLRRAYAQIGNKKIDPAIITDDAGLVEALGETVFVVEGESTNFKITRPEDMALASAYVASIEKAQAASLAKKRLFADEEE